MLSKYLLGFVHACVKLLCLHNLGHFVLKSVLMSSAVWYYNAALFWCLETSTEYFVWTQGRRKAISGGKKKYNMLGINYSKFVLSPVKEIEMESTTLAKLMATNPVWGHQLSTKILKQFIAPNKSSDWLPVWLYSFSVGSQSAHSHGNFNCLLCMYVI